MARLPSVNMSGLTVPSGFKHLQSSLLAAPAAAITFSGIGATYLELRLTAQMIPATDNADLLVRLNNDSGANYDGAWMANAPPGPSAANAGDANQTSWRLGGISGTFSDAGRPNLIVLTIAKYVSSIQAIGVRTGHLWFNSGPAFYNMQGAMRWENVAALISRVDLLASSGNLDTGTLARLEGLAP